MIDAPPNTPCRPFVTNRLRLTMMATPTSLPRLLLFGATLALAPTVHADQTSDKYLAAGDAVLAANTTNWYIFDAQQSRCLPATELAKTAGDKYITDPYAVVAALGLKPIEEHGVYVIKGDTGTVYGVIVKYWDPNSPWFISSDTCLLGVRILEREGYFAHNAEIEQKRLDDWRKYLHPEQH